MALEHLHPDDHACISWKCVVAHPELNLLVGYSNSSESGADDADGWVLETAQHLESVLLSESCCIGDVEDVLEITTTSIHTSGESDPRV